MILLLEDELQTQEFASIQEPVAPLSLELLLADPALKDFTVDQLQDCVDSAIPLPESLTKDRNELTNWYIFPNVVLGTGSFAKGYLGYDVNLQRAVAIKKLYEEGKKNLSTLISAKDPLRVEAQIQASNIFCLPQVYGYRQDQQGDEYIIMEYLNSDWKNLNEYVKEHTSVENIPLNLEVLQRIAEAIKVLADVGKKGKHLITPIFHYDLGKNIMINLSCVDAPIKLLDLGANAYVQSKYPKSKLIIYGNLLGLSPARALNADARTPDQLITQKDEVLKNEIFALASMLYYLITGSKPYNDIEQIEENETLYITNPGLAPAISQLLEDVIHYFHFHKETEFDSSTSRFAKFPKELQTAINNQTREIDQFIAALNYLKEYISKTTTVVDAPDHKT